MRFWFFADGGKKMIASVDCSLESARRLADSYNRDPASEARIDLIADSVDPDAATMRIAVTPPSPEQPS
jgi:hypothetical protein